MKRMYYFIAILLCCTSLAQAKCLPPVDIKADILDPPEKDHIVIFWQPSAGSDPIQHYEMYDFQAQKLWAGRSPKDRAHLALAFPFGENVYELYSICTTGISEKVKFTYKKPR